MLSTLLNDTSVTEQSLLLRFNHVRALRQRVTAFYGDTQNNTRPGTRFSFPFPEVTNFYRMLERITDFRFVDLLARSTVLLFKLFFPLLHAFI